MHTVTFKKYVLKRARFWVALTNSCSVWGEVWEFVRLAMGVARRWLVSVCRANSCFLSFIFECGAERENSSADVPELLEDSMHSSKTKTPPDIKANVPHIFAILLQCAKSRGNHEPQQIKIRSRHSYVVRKRNMKAKKHPKWLRLAIYHML